jgi:hypothetical protein
LFLQKGKRSAKIIIDSADEVSRLKLKKAKMLGTGPVAGQMSVEVMSSRDGVAETIAVLRQQNQNLRRILEIQKPLIDLAMQQIRLSDRGGLRSCVYHKGSLNSTKLWLFRRHVVMVTR